MSERVEGLFWMMLRKLRPWKKRKALLGGKMMAKFIPKEAGSQRKREKETKIERGKNLLPSFLALLFPTGRSSSPFRRLSVVAAACARCTFLISLRLSLSLSLSLSVSVHAVRTYVRIYSDMLSRSPRPWERVLPPRLALRTNVVRTV